MKKHALKIGKSLSIGIVWFFGMLSVLFAFRLAERSIWWLAGNDKMTAVSWAIMFAAIAICYTIWPLRKQSVPIIIFRAERLANSKLSATAPIYILSDQAAEKVRDLEQAALQLQESENE